MKFYRYIALLLVASMILTACAQATSQPPTADSSQEPAAAGETGSVGIASTSEPAPVENIKPVVIASPNDMTNLDPHRQSGMFPYRSLMYWVFDVLVNADREGKPEAELAQEWTRIDSLTWEFKLVPGIKFQNGEVLNAEAVKLSFDRMQEKDLIGYNQVFWRTGLKEIKVIDDTTVQLITETPAPDMLFWLSEAFIVPPKYYTEHDDEYLAQHPIGSGPYKFVEWAKDDHITFIANQDYFQGPPNIKDLILKVIPEASSRLNELITGNVDLITSIRPDQAEQANTDISNLVTTEGWRKMHVGISMIGPDFLKNKLVRQAMNYAVDKQTIIDTMMLGATSPLQSIINAPLNNPKLEPYPYDPEKAKELLKEAGYPDGFTVKFQTPIERYGMDKDISLVIAQNLAEVGIKTEFEALEWGKYREYTDARSFEGLNFMGLSTYIVLAPQLGTFMYEAVHDNPTNYNNPEYEAMLSEFFTTDDDEKRQELSFKMQEFIWDDCPWIFLWRLPMFIGMSNRLQWEPHPALYVDMWEASLK